MAARSNGALDVIREALAGSGLDLLGSAPIEDYDRRAPVALRAALLMPAARGIVVVGSAGRTLWAEFTRDRALLPPSEKTESPCRTHGDIPLRSVGEHPLDAHVARSLDRADRALAREGIASRRFEPTLYASPALDFRALGEMTGLGSLGPFGMLIHEVHGPWWALRGAWLVDAVVPAPLAHRAPCAGCPSPCVAGLDRAPGVALATPEVRGRCVVGQASRYLEEQIAYHYA